VQKAVGKRRLPMVDMGDDAEITNMSCVHLKNTSDRAWLKPDDPRPGIYPENGKAHGLKRG
jgi:hypothetical protein